MMKYPPHIVKELDQLPKTRDDFEREFEAAKSASTGQLLIRTARLFNERAVARGPTLRGFEEEPQEK